MPQPGRPRAGRGLLMALGAAAAFVVVALAVLPAAAKSLTTDAFTEAADGTAAGLRSGEEKAALAKRLNPLSLDPVYAQASFAERGNQPRKAARLLVDAVDEQPDNPDAWNRLLRFQALLDDTTAATASLRVLFDLDPVLADRVAIYTALVNYDPARSASATGTPLPERLRRPRRRAGERARPGHAAVRRRRRPGHARAPQPAPTPAPAPTPTPTPAPSPTPAPPTPAPKQQPKTPSAPEGDPFRLEG